MGAFFYLPTFYAFGLNPFPYHAFLFVLLAVNVYLTYRLATLLGSRKLVAALAALVMCYHAGLANLYYDTAFIYDVLCFCFYIGALVYYASIRNRHRTLSGFETAVFTGLFVCALNSKEMAVTLPVMLVAYEWLYSRPDPKSRIGWKFSFLRSWRVWLTAGVIDVLYVYGKMFGPNAPTKMPAYRPVFSMARLLDFQRRELVNLFFQWKFSGIAPLLVLWVCLSYIALRRRRPVLVFCLLFILITPLPIEFLEGRDGGCLAIPLAGWALFAAEVFVSLAAAISRAVARAPGIPPRGRSQVFGAVILLGVFFWAAENQYLHSYTVQEVPQIAPATEEVIRQLRQMNPSVRPHSRVLFLRDPFVDWDMVFIGELWFHDRTVEVRSNHKTPMSPEEIAKFDYIFDWVDGRLVRIR